MPPTSESARWNPGRFAATLKEILGACGLTPARAADLANISRSQVNRWMHGENQPDYTNVHRLATALEDRYPGLSTLTTDLITHAGYNRPAGQYSEQGPVTPVRGFFVDLSDPNERKLWSLDAHPRVKEAVVAFFRMINTPQGRAAVDGTFDDEEASERDMRRRA